MSRRALQRGLPRTFPVPLVDLEAFIFQTRLGGKLYDVLWFLCPLPLCSHGCGIPFSDEPLHDVETLPGESGLKKVWQRTAGSGPADLTLIPSYWLRGKESCGLHVNVTNGRLTR